MWINLMPQQHATVLAALRSWQAQDLMLACDGTIGSIATNCGAFEALNSEAIDALCERLNEGDGENAEAYRDAVPTSAGDLEVDSDAVVSTDDDGEGAYVMCWKWVSNVSAGLSSSFDEEGELL